VLQHHHFVNEVQSPTCSARPLAPICAHHREPPLQGTLANVLLRSAALAVARALSGTPSWAARTGPRCRSARDKDADLPAPTTCCPRALHHLKQLRVRVDWCGTSAHHIVLAYSRCPSLALSCARARAVRSLFFPSRSLALALALALALTLVILFSRAVPFLHLLSLVISLYLIAFEK
jgi:hypothetical protein